MTTRRFQAILKRPEGVGTWTYLDIPFGIAEAFGCHGQVKIKGTIDGHPFRSSALPHGDGTHYLVVNKTIRDAVGAKQGDTVTVTLEADTAARAVSLPADLKRALDKNAGARAAFQALSYSHRKEYAEWIKGAKKPETRARRIAQALEMLREGSTPKRGTRAP